MHGCSPPLYNGGETGKPYEMHDRQHDEPSTRQFPGGISAHPLVHFVGHSDGVNVDGNRRRPEFGVWQFCGSGQFAVSGHDMNDDELAVSGDEVALDPRPVAGMLLRETMQKEEPR